MSWKSVPDSVPRSASLQTRGTRPLPGQCLGRGALELKEHRDQASMDGNPNTRKKGSLRTTRQFGPGPGPRFRTPSAKSTAPPSKRDLSQVPGEPTPLAPQPPEGTSRAGKQTGPARSARSVSSSGLPARPCLGRRGSPRGTAHSQQCWGWFQLCHLAQLRHSAGRAPSASASSVSESQNWSAG